MARGSVVVRSPAGPPLESKRYRVGTHRVVSPAKTVDSVNPHLERFGITRVADVTGLDVIGIPVTHVFRPNARTISVAAGKGVELAAAKASGVMEAVEVACAEFPSFPTEVQPAARLRLRAALIDLERIDRASGAALGDEVAIPWVEGIDLLVDKPTWVPAEIVELDFVRACHENDGRGWFGQSSDGLASGNTWEEAVLHGLCELLERDATARFRRRAAPAADQLVDLGSIDPVSSSLVQRFESAGIAVAVWETTGKSGLPSFSALIADPHADPRLHPIPVCGGHGCHTDRSVALSRALTEAAQSRLTAIVGSREDVQPVRERSLRVLGLLESHQRVIEAATLRGRVKFTSVPNASTDSVSADLVAALGRVDATGVGQVVVVDLSPSDVPINVIRVITPGLQSDLHDERGPTRLSYWP